MADEISNSLLVSAPPSDLDDIGQLVEALDQQPPMVLVELLIAEATLGTDENASAKQPSKAGRGEEEPQVVGLPKHPHFSADRLKRGIDERLHELQKGKRLEILYRPQLMTLHNVPALLQIGSREPVVRASRSGPAGPVKQINFENVGLMVTVTPRVTFDGSVVVELEVTISRLASSGEGRPASASSAEQAVGAPRTLTNSVQGTVSVEDGATVVLGGLMTKSESGQKELLILLSARIVKPEAAK